MDNFNRTESNTPLKITSEEIKDQRVDDYINRQKNLMGETSINRGKRKWWTKNWFVLMLAGSIGALAAWAILEPSQGDSVYYQGPIKESNLWVSMPPSLSNYPGSGYVVIGDLQIWMMLYTKEFDPETGEVKPLIATTLDTEERLGVYADNYLTIQDQEVAFAAYVVRNPPVNDDERENTPFSRLVARDNIAGALLFPLVAGFIGLFIGLIDGLICRVYRRAFLSALVGFLCGFVGGLIMGIPANLIYEPITNMAVQDFQFGTKTEYSALGFFMQMGGRGLAWAVVGMAAGLGQGIVLGSKRLLFYGFIGGIIGGLLGGLLFDPIYFLVQGGDIPEAWLSRMIGLASIGALVGAMIGIVELLARDAWLRMQQGPLTGKEFLIFKDSMVIGSSPRCELYLFNDDGVSQRHAILRTVGDNHEIESLSSTSPVSVNGRISKRSSLRHGDRIVIGSTAFIYEKRNG